MKNKKYSIVYSSLTGNTKELADAIHEALPQDECEYFGVSDTVIPSSELLYIGFWTDKGNADTKTLQLLSQLKNKQIFLFGTAGFGGSDIYFRKILNQVKQFVDASNVIVGEYMCQGRMPQSVRERYLKMKEAPDHPANLDVLIQNFKHNIQKTINGICVQSLCITQIRHSVECPVQYTVSVDQYQFLTHTLSILS